MASVTAAGVIAGMKAVGSAIVGASLVDDLVGSPVKRALIPGYGGSPQVPYISDKSRFKDAKAEGAYNYVKYLSDQAPSYVSRHRKDYIRRFSAAANAKREDVKEIRKTKTIKNLSKTKPDLKGN